jgi:hypothetical protein
MRRASRGAALALAVVVSLVPRPARAIVFGLESASDEMSGSGAPTVLFSLEEVGSAVNVIANVTLADADIHADGLAQSATYGLMGYQLVGSTSQLIEIDPSTGAASAVGAALAGRAIRAAGFDADERLWAIDVVASDLLEIDPTTGAVVGSPVNLKLGDGDFAIASLGSDLAFRSDGVAILVDSNSVYTLDVATGALVLLFTDAVHQTGDVPIFLVGAAFPSGTGTGDLFVFDVNGGDDVFVYQDLALPRVLYDDDPVATNAGRGDLASIPFGTLDVDGNGQTAALTDGLLVLRRLFGLTGSPLVANAVGAGCTRCDGPAVELFVGGLGLLLDVDGNGTRTALTDGLLVVRWLFGLDGAALVQGVVAGDCTRCTALEIEPYLESLRPQP